MTDAAAELFTRKSVELFTIDYLPKIDRSVGPLSVSDVWWRPNEISNSIGNLILHLNGNVTQWMVGGVGEQPYERVRQQEFDERRTTPAPELLARLTRTVDEAVAIISRQTAASLAGRRAIQGYDVTVLEAIYHVVEHFSMHTGQIIMLAKMRTGRDLNLWKPVENASAKDLETE